MSDVVESFGVADVKTLVLKGLELAELIADKIGNATAQTAVQTAKAILANDALWALAMKIFSKPQGELDTGEIEQAAAAAKPEGLGEIVLAIQFLRWAWQAIQQFRSLQNAV
jgi:hypothetical protein